MKKCQYCNEEIQDDAVKCRFCGEWLNKESQINAAPVEVKFPKLWPGYIIGLVSLALQLFTFLLPPLAPHEVGPRMVFVTIASVVLWLIGLAYWCICLYKIHENILKMADNQYPISPARAVAFGFIPFYNLYWMFKWPSETINFVNTRDKSKRLTNWFPGLVLLLSSLFSIFISFIWFIGSFGILSYLVNTLKKNLAVQPQATPYKTKPTPFPVWAIVVLICIPIFFIGLVVAIAIPNFIKVKGGAQKAACLANLHMINTAKQVWAMETGAEGSKTPSWSDLIPNYIKEKPTCSKEGIYEIGNIDSTATCSIGDNGTVNPDDDHTLRR